MNEVLSFFIRLSLVLVVLSFEQVYGVPFLALALTLYFTTNTPEAYRLAFLLVVGITIAIFFQIALALGVALTLSLSAAFIYSKSVLPGVEMRLFFISFLGAVVTLLVALIPLNLVLISSIVVSGVVAAILSRLLYQPRVIQQLNQVRHR